MKNIFFFIFFFSSLCFAEERSVKILLVDSPIDYNHPQLKNKIDFETLQKTPYQESIESKKNSISTSWLDANQNEFKRNYQKYSNIQYKLLRRSYEFDEAKFYYPELISLKDLTIPFEFPVRFLRYLINNHDEFATLLHGTFVASQAVAGLQNVSLYNYPYIRSDITKSEIEFNDFLKTGDAQKISNRYASVFHELDQFIKINGIHFVNLSVGFLNENFYYVIKNYADSQKISLTPIDIQKLSKILQKDVHSSFKNFITQNPNTAFILSAGNDSRDSDFFKYSLTNLKNDNLIVVASTDFKKKISTFSNFHKDKVQIAAVGVARGALAGSKGDIWMQGTSMASPRVTQAMACYFQKNLHFKEVNKDFIHQFFANKTIKVEKLTSYVHEGRFLNKSLFISTLDRDAQCL